MSKFKKGDLVIGNELNSYQITNKCCVCEVLSVLDKLVYFDAGIKNGNNAGNMVVKPIISSEYGKKKLPEKVFVLRKYFEHATREDVERLRKEFLLGDI